MSKDEGQKENTPWALYILQCADGSFYTGITNNLPRRLAAHAAGKGAKYTRGRAPLQLVYEESHGSRSAASKREAALKGLSRDEKAALVADKRK